MLGRLLDTLEKSPHADNTVVVLWSDHGWQLGEKEHWRKFGLWDNVLRTVPMIKAELARHIPRAPLKQTSQKLSRHHFPPFRSHAEYESHQQGRQGFTEGAAEVCDSRLATAVDRIREFRA